MSRNGGRELARRCEGIFIITFDEWGSTPPRIWNGGILGALIIIENTDIVTISAWREKRGELGLEQVFEG